MIHVSHKLTDWQARRRGLDGRSIGFVPTMGALHRGHASLVERCREENGVVVVSIFVNPSQFNDPADLERYPRDLERDLALLESLGTDEVIAPSAADMYPDGYRFRIEPHPADLVLEGEYRPGHLQGVTTVVMKLLNLARADRAYFGEKDYQQLRIVTGLAREFFLTTEIVACPTVREESGLAMSSRNERLSAEARRTAACLFPALNTAASCGEAKEELEARGFMVEYVEERWGRRLAAAHLDGVRLIDNVPARQPFRLS
ncbi:MAG: pantoate--beta-alanine ligase [Acidobacteriota bacterium]|nr:pantoate--beta-alanine ligase [Acidobacteriota bacterium]